MAHPGLGVSRRLTVLGLCALFSVAASWALLGPRSDTSAQIATHGLEAPSDQHTDMPTDGLQPSNIIGTDDRTQTSNTAVAPYSQAVHIELFGSVFDLFPSPFAESTCSGTLVGPDTVITAAHCLYHHDTDDDDKAIPGTGDFISSARVIPGRQGLTEPFGSQFGAQVSVPGQWITTAAPEWDFGLIRLPNANLTNQTGFSQVVQASKASLDGLDYNPTIFGYPGDKPSGTQWISEKPAFVFVDDQEIYYKMDSYGGLSGSGVRSGASNTTTGPFKVIGVHAYGCVPPEGQDTCPETSENSGVRINHTVRQSLENQCASLACSMSIEIEEDPKPIPAIPRQVTGGGKHSCGVVDGGALCWGDNEFGQLGIADLPTPLVPTQVAGLDSEVGAIDAGYFHTCAIKSGAAWCWGQNISGQLGSGTFDSSQVPVPVVGMGSGVTAISAGGAHTCAIKNSEVWCWGANGIGTLGDGTSGSSNIPVKVINITGPATRVSAGVAHTCAVVNGGAMCWGWGLYGRLGNNSTAVSLSPVAVSGMPALSGVTRVEVGIGHSCAVQSGSLWCWGDNLYGQLGVGPLPDDRSLIPVKVLDLPEGWVNVTAGETHTCGLTGALGAYCWGGNEFGQLGNGGFDPTSTPFLPAMHVGGGTLTSISAGLIHTCGVDFAYFYCWGSNQFNELGTGTNDNEPKGVGVGNLAPTPTPTPRPPSEETAAPIFTPSPTPEVTPTPVSPTATPASPTPTPKVLVWGDGNCSGAADPVDALLTLRHDASLTTNTGACPPFGQLVEVESASPHLWGDVDCSGDVTPVDSLKLLRADVGLSVVQEPNCPSIGADVIVS